MITRRWSVQRGLLLPVTLARQRGLLQPATIARQRGSGQAWMKIQSVMLVDDEPDIRTIAELALGTVTGWRVTVAGSGAEALAELERSTPDVILLDVVMPGIDGPTLLATLRGEPRTARIPVIFLTAAAQRQQTDELLALGACGVIRKPFDPMSLAEQVRRLVGEQS